MSSLTQWWRRRVLTRERARYHPNDLEQVWRRIPALDGFSDADIDRLTDLALLFLRDKRLEAAGGLILTDAMRLTIALQACLPILELGLHWYRGWYAVIVYPDEFIPGHEIIGEDGVVGIETLVKSGEAWERGPVILSWADVESALESTGYNVVLHEMAHKLDMRDGQANGCPPLPASIARARWARDFSVAYANLCARVDAGEETPIDPYASESPAEFFAVVSEVFFESPEVLHAEYPDVHRLLGAFYRQDPLRRLRG